MNRAVIIILLIAVIIAAPLLFIRIYFYGLFSRPDVILITANALRPDHLSCYGYGRMRTGSMDGLAKTGVLFQNAYCNVPIQVYGYTSILTGEAGNLALSRKNNRLVPDKPLTLLGARLKAAGYSTAAIAADASFLPAIDPNTAGFDVYSSITEALPEKERALRDRFTTDKAIAVLKELKKKGKPVFMWVSYAIPLYPYDLPDDFKKIEDDFPYDRQVLLLEEEVAKLSEGLRQLRMSKNSLVIFTSACGESFGEHGEPSRGIFIYNSTIKIPLIMKFPKAAGDKKVKAPVSHADIVPTILDCLKIKYGKDDFDGESLLGRAGGKETPLREVYLESLEGYYTFGWSPLVGVVSDGYKYIDAPEPELYDLSKDPHELSNIALRDKKKASELKDKLTQFVKSKRTQLSEIMGKGADPKRKIELLTPYRMLANPLKEKDLKVVTSLCEELVRQDPNNKAFKHALSQLYLRGGRIGEAESCLVSIVKDYPDFTPAWELLGDAFSQDGKLENAVKCYEKALSIDPDSGSIKNKLKLIVKSPEGGKK